MTQNVDRLHQRVGSRDVVELHGNIAEVRCAACSYGEDAGWPLTRGSGFAAEATLPDAERPPRVKGWRELADEPRCPECRNWLRPCVVWFNEALPDEAVARATDAVERCDVFMSIGTSGTVWPAAQFAYDARSRGAKVIEINLDPTPLTREADLALHGRSGEILPELVARMQRA